MFDKTYMSRFNPAKLIRTFSLPYQFSQREIRKKKSTKQGWKRIGANRTFDPERGLAGSDSRERVLDLHKLS
jgi:hypothetical protein